MIFCFASLTDWLIVAIQYCFCCTLHNHWHPENPSPCYFSHSITSHGTIPALHHSQKICGNIPYSAENSSPVACLMVNLLSRTSISSEDILTCIDIFWWIIFVFLQVSFCFCLLGIFHNHLNIIVNPGFAYISLVSDSFLLLLVFFIAAQGSGVDSLML